MNGALELGIAISALCVGVAVHEISHYVVARCYGVGASFGWNRERGMVGNPCVRVDGKQLTVQSAILIGLSPLSMHIPILGMIAVYMATGNSMGPLVLHAMFWWGLASIPSVTDMGMVLNATEVDDLHAVWYGDHERHRFAEGIP